MTMRRILPTTLLTAFLVLTLSACSSDCPACKTLQPDTLSIQLCASKVPDPQSDERICTEVTNVTYTFMKAD
jgi:hypothetical protein